MAYDSTVFIIFFLLFFFLFLLHLVLSLFLYFPIVILFICPLGFLLSPFLYVSPSLYLSAYLSVCLMLLSLIGIHVESLPVTSIYFTMLFLLAIIITSCELDNLLPARPVRKAVLFSSRSYFPVTFLYIS